MGSGRLVVGLWPLLRNDKVSSALRMGAVWKMGWAHCGIRVTSGVRRHSNHLSSFSLHLDLP